MYDVVSAFTSLRSIIVLSKNEADALDNPAYVSGLAAKWHTDCMTLESVSFPEGTWIKSQKVRTGDFERSGVSYSASLFFSLRS